MQIEKCEKCEKQEHDLEKWNCHFLCANCSDRVHAFITFNE